LGGGVAIVDLTGKLVGWRGEGSVQRGRHFNGERQVRENFNSEVQRKRYLSYVINPILDEQSIG
jgi:hypothetical protein